jgi:hypothetical protein
MDDQSNHVDEESQGANVPAVGEPETRTEWYETDDGVVLYDAENPLAWIQARETVQLPDAA